MNEYPSGADSDSLVRNLVMMIYCGEIDSYSNVIEDALHRRAAVVSGARDRGPVLFTSKVLVVDGKPVIKVTRGRS